MHSGLSQTLRLSFVVGIMSLQILQRMVMHIISPALSSGIPVSVYALSPYLPLKHLR